MQSATGILLESDGAGPDLDSVEEINAVLAQVGARIWTHDLSDLPGDLKDFLADPDPSPERVEAVKPRFLLSRERLLEIIAAAGRKPSVPGGGELVTVDVTHGVTYPQLYVARESTDFSRFDRLHVNLSDDGTPVEDIVQLLCGSGLVVKIRLPVGETVTVTLSCPNPESGWLLTVDCRIPFIGSFSSAASGTKALSQVIGPARWNMEYVE